MLPDDPGTLAAHRARAERHRDDLPAASRELARAPHAQHAHRDRRHTDRRARQPILGTIDVAFDHAHRARGARRRPHQRPPRVRALSIGGSGAGRAHRGAHQGSARVHAAKSACRSRRSCWACARARSADPAPAPPVPALPRHRQRAAAHLRERASREPRRVRRGARAGADREHDAFVRGEHQLGRVQRLVDARRGTSSTTAAG